MDRPFRRHLASRELEAQIQELAIVRTVGMGGVLPYIAWSRHDFLSMPLSSLYDLMNKIAKERSALEQALSESKNSRR